MSKRIEGYLRAIEEGTVEQFHDYHDVQHARIPREDYERKWGHYTGQIQRKKHVR